jgi:L-lactate dehydrogenase
MQRTAFIVGAGGKVGATAAYAMALKRVVSEIVLIDVAEQLVHGQAMDISHATSFTNGVRVRAGDYSDIKPGDIIVITCGAPQKPGQTRLELLEINAGIIREVVQQITRVERDVFIVLVSNPVDVLTHLALEVSGLPKERVFGTGTALDTARLRVQLARDLHVTQQEIEAYVLGEHGDSSFVARSGARIGGIPLTEFPGFSAHMLSTIDHDIRSAAYKIIETKGNSHFGIGDVVAELVGALQQEQASIFAVSALTTGEYGLKDVVVGLPALVNSKGVRLLDRYPLDEDELGKLHASAEVIKKATQAARKPTLV